jgi:hypothetical protein
LKGRLEVLTGDLVPIQIKVLLEEEEPTEEEEERALDRARKEVKRQQRTEYEALEEAIPDLIRLERYERRAWSRQKRAIQEFVQQHRVAIAGNGAGPIYVAQAKFNVLDTGQKTRTARTLGRRYISHAKRHARWLQSHPGF